MSSPSCSASDQVSASIVQEPQSCFWVLFPWLFVAAIGLLSLMVALLWEIWTNDPLRSIGICIALVSVTLTVRSWRQSGWEMHGTWWGIVPLLCGAILGAADSTKPQIVFVALWISVHLLPLGLIVFAYGSGVVLLLGGTKVWRRALFPLGLLLFVNPVPAVFAGVDLSLQYACARIAETFAHVLGVHPDSNALHLFFAPGFGMFIAPGCNGMRGAISMGYLALVLGYLYQCSAMVRVGSFFGALTLGYVLNLARLCGLVLFYSIAVHLPTMQAHAKGFDYVLGAFFFLCAALALVTIIRRASHRTKNGATQSLPELPHDLESYEVYSTVRKGIVCSIVVLLSTVICLRTIAEVPNRRRASNDFAAYVGMTMPRRIGTYTLIRTWVEYDHGGNASYRWGVYARDRSVNELSVGFYLTPVSHYSAACYIYRGLRPVWRSVRELPASNGAKATFWLDFYAQRGEVTLDASTVCEEGGCTAHRLFGSELGIILGDLNGWRNGDQPTSNPVSVLVRQHSTYVTVPSLTTRDTMLRELENFVSGVDTSFFQQSHGSQK